MGLTEEEKNTIVKYRLERARETLLDVDISIQNNRWNNAANRLYYACFYATIALLLNDGFEARSHNGVRTLLGQHYVNEGIINKELSQAYRKMFNLRQTGDYDDLAVVTKDEVLDLLEPAKQFIKTIEQLILKNT
ncbi:MAG: HEPN domain-containing protein [Bacteroidales bacterium]|nr:HEPN domain-containing protein [Bacteroidales bacterium]